jgi:hypothetical protein
MAMLMRTQAENRFCVVRRIKALSLGAVKRDILRMEGACGDFVTIDTALPAACQTRFAVYEVGRDLLVAIALFDIEAFKSGDESKVVRDEVEIFFDLRHDHIGFFQFVFQADGGILRVHHQPYPESRSTAFPWLQPRKVRWQTPEAGAAFRGQTPAWVFAWFAVDAVFRHDRRCGFNVARSVRHPHEPSSWNPCSGTGFQDATSFGHLYRRPPDIDLGSILISREGASLAIEGGGTIGRGVKLELKNPHGKTTAVAPRVKRQGWRADVRLIGRTPGRYRLEVKAPEPLRVEPGCVAFDLSSPGRRPDFTVGMTYDIPDDVLVAPVPYTPEALGEELGLLARHGVRRIYWIDYAPQSTVWRLSRDDGRSRRSHENCGDFLPLAARLSKQMEMEFIGVYKPYDIGFNFSQRDRPDRSLRYAALEAENRLVPLPPELGRNQASTMRTHPGWSAPVRYPVRRLRVYSLAPVPRLRTADIRVWVSPDNRAFRPYRGPLALRQGVVARPHFRWTPAEPVREPGTARNEFLELSGLTISDPFVAVELKKPGVTLRHRAFAFIEAWDGRGEEVPVMLATGGDTSTGLTFWKEWVSWCNRSPRLAEEYAWKTGVNGLRFGLPDRLPTLLEPAYEASRRAWLDAVARILATEADGVDIRTLCHHNGVMDYLTYAFAEPVRETFRTRYGREVSASTEDMERVRRLRGDFYTDFLRGAKALAARRGKKLIAHLECGIEVPPSCDQRMQIHLDWETWMKEGILDEVSLKWWFPQNPFIHERVLPLARRLSIPVHICDRNSSLFHTPRAIERAEALIRDAAAAGFSGYFFYEACDFKYRNAENRPMFRHHMGEALRRAAEAAERKP